MQDGLVVESDTVSIVFEEGFNVRWFRKFIELAVFDGKKVTCLDAGSVCDRFQGDASGDSLLS